MGEADGHQKVASLGLLRRQAAVGDRVLAGDANLHVPFVLHHAVHHVAPRIVGIHRISCPAYHILHGGRALAIGLRHHVASHHPARFAYVELRRHVVVLLVFVPGPPPSLHLHTDILRYARVVGEEIEQPQSVIHMPLINALPLAVSGLGIVPILAYHVGRDRAAIVHVGLAAWHDAPYKAVVHASLPRLHLLPAEQELVASGVVAFRTRDGDAFGGIVGQRQAEVIGLYAAVGLPLGAHLAGQDAPEEPAAGIALFPVGIHSVGKLMILAHVEAVELLAIGLVALAPHGIGHPRTCHQVALVGAVDKDPGADALPPLFHAPRGPLEQDALYVVPPFLDAADASLHVHLDACLAQHVAIDSQSHFGLEQEGRLARAIRLSHPAVETEGEALDDFHLADVCHTQPACGESADAWAGLDEQDAVSLPTSLDGSRDAGRCGAIDADVRLPLGGQCLPCLLGRSPSCGQSQGEQQKGFLLHIYLRTYVWARRRFLALPSPCRTAKVQLLFHIRTLFGG